MIGLMDHYSRGAPMLCSNKMSTGKVCLALFLPNPSTPVRELPAPDVAQVYEGVHKGTIFIADTGESFLVRRDTLLPGEQPLCSPAAMRARLVMSPQAYTPPGWCAVKK